MFSFIPVTIDHMPLLRTWFNEPHVSQWWPTPASEEDFFAHFLKRIRSLETRPCLAQLDKVSIGYIQYYRIDPSGEKTGKVLPPLPDNTIGTDPSLRQTQPTQCWRFMTASADRQFIGDPAYIGKGYGTRMLTAFIEFIKVHEPQVTAIIVDPDPENRAAIRCYEKVGFAYVGVYETPWGMAYLMQYDIHCVRK